MAVQRAPAPGRPPGPFGGHGGGPGGGLGMSLPAEKARNFKASFRRLLGRLRPERTIIIVVLVLAVTSVFFGVLGPKLLGDATNVVFDGIIGAQPTGVDFTELGRIIVIVIVVYTISSVFSWGQNYLMAGVTQRTMYRLREEVDTKIGRLPLRHFDTHSRGDLLSRVTNDIDNISTTMQQSLTQAITSILTVLGVLLMMVWISPLLAAVSLLTVPLSFVVTVLIAKRSQKQFVGQWTWTGRVNGHVEEMYTGHDLVAVFGHRAQAVAEFDEANARMYESSFRAQFISGIIQPAMMFIANLNYVVIAVVGGIQVANGTLSLGSVQAFIQYSRQFTIPITQLASITNLIQSGVASAERVFAFLDEPEEEPDAAAPRPLGRPRGHIEFDSVSFRYSPDKPLIDDMSLDVRPGQAVAIVGPTGAGKTTLVNLLMRFYEIDAGAIRIDGVDTRLVTRDELRRSFGMVLQDTWLFGGTVRDNIAYGADGATDQAIIDAARAAHVDHFVRTMPDGYDTVLDEEAANLSAGEKQLLTIARAFLADPPILILDEATSSVDTRTEVLIQQAMARLRADRTSFVIAHRLSTIRDADIILVMDAGRIVEQGTHDELLAAQGFYARLYSSQFAGAATD